MAASEVLALPVLHGHATHVARLPLHHRDPFDRMLIAQAQLEGLAVMTSDPRFASYGVETILA